MCDSTCLRSVLKFVRFASVSTEWKNLELIFYGNFIYRIQAFMIQATS